VSSDRRHEGDCRRLEQRLHLDGDRYRHLATVGTWLAQELREFAHRGHIGRTPLKRRPSAILDTFPLAQHKVPSRSASPPAPGEAQQRNSAGPDDLDVGACGVAVALCAIVGEGQAAGVAALHLVPHPEVASSQVRIRRNSSGTTASQRDRNTRNADAARTWNI
jgi:hypothetical protein